MTAAGMFVYLCVILPAECSTTDFEQFSLFVFPSDVSGISMRIMSSVVSSGRVQLS